MSKLAWDSAEWRIARNAMLQQWMLNNEDAIACVLDLSAISETWDDLIDKDRPVADAEINAAFAKALVVLNNNPFFLQHHAQIMAVVVCGVNAWFDANDLEKSDDVAERMLAFYIRNYCYEIVSLCAFLVGGYDHLRKISLEMRKFFQHESYLTWEKRL